MSHRDKYQLVTSESSLRDYKLQLKQLLELDGTEEMDLVLPEPVSYTHLLKEELIKSGSLTKEEMETLDDFLSTVHYQSMDPADETRCV